MAEILTPIPFHGDTLYLLEYAGEPYVPLRPICEALGLEWERQRKKAAQGRFARLTRLCTAVAQDGKRRDMLCIPLRKLPGWLYAISPAKVRPDIRPKLERYQDECDEVLWRHWQGQGTRGVEVSPLPAGSSFLPVRIRGAWHYLRLIPNVPGGGTSLYVALLPVLACLGLNRTVVQAICHRNEGGRPWGITGIGGDPLWKLLEPERWDMCVSIIPVHELAAFARDMTPNPACAQVAAQLASELLAAWHAHVLGLKAHEMPAPPALPPAAGTERAAAVPPAMPSSDTSRPAGAARCAPLSDGELEFMRQRCIEGESFQAIARALGRSHASVRWALRGMAVHDRDLPPRAGGRLRGLDDAGLRLLHALRSHGRPMRQLAALSGVSSDLLALAFRGMAQARGSAGRSLRARPKEAA